MSQVASFKTIQPRNPSLKECRFYHSVNLPTGDVSGEWDLRKDVDVYLGNVEFTGKSVFEVGPASGFLSIHMEKAGAKVTCLEPPMSHLWDTVPFEGFDVAAWREDFIKNIEGVRNSFWHYHAIHRSSVRMIETDPYNIQPDVGDYDIGLLASVLLHTRSPFNLLEQVARRVRETIIVTETYNPDLGKDAICRLLPHRGIQQVDTWWQFSPGFFFSSLGLLGFTEARFLSHHQYSVATNQIIPMFTAVCSRPKSAA
jgi:hypothetical protein